MKTKTDVIVYATVCANFRTVEAIANQTGFTVAAVRVSLVSLQNRGKVTLHPTGAWFPRWPGAIVVRAA